MQHRHVGCWEETNWVIMSTDAQAVQETLNRQRNAGRKPRPRMELLMPTCVARKRSHRLRSAHGRISGAAKWSPHKARLRGLLSRCVGRGSCLIMPTLLGCRVSPDFLRRPAEYSPEIKSGRPAPFVRPEIKVRPPGSMSVRKSSPAARPHSSARKSKSGRPVL